MLGLAIWEKIAIVGACALAIIFFEYGYISIQTEESKGNLLACIRNCNLLCNYGDSLCTAFFLPVVN